MIPSKQKNHNEAVCMSYVTYYIWLLTLRMHRECRERFPCHRLQRKQLVSEFSMHHGTCVRHVPWCMSGSPTCGGVENVPGTPSVCATRHFKYLVRCPCFITYAPHQVLSFQALFNARFVNNTYISGVLALWLFQPVGNKSCTYSIPSMLWDLA